ncbi:OOP family OmpA-OmpF porin [Inhella inkyongensis]|uniref:OOP family OmpA-OmpF porin n=1 Tax=Inhella inkyongensis TaxID=392593 RepID=A0A840SAQ8_9BURK|nr:outer membrane beta-barrel protein [Inhella inkyongensis]MBB5205469.1 OOP family OmpA-OmpF porin [Inhella inkyongensis]
MKSRISLSVAAALLSLLALQSTHAAGQRTFEDRDDYIGFSAGASVLAISSPSATVVSDSTSGRPFKAYYGFRLSENWAIEAGYAHLGRYTERTRQANVTSEQTVNTKLFYGAAVGTLNLGEHFALHGRLGVANNRARGGTVPAGAQGLAGSKTSLMAGIGAEYRFHNGLSLHLDADRFGNFSPRLAAAAVTLGLRYSY